MKPLSLSLMPSPLAGDAVGSPALGTGGFVDDEAAMELIAGPRARTGRIVPDELVLPADESDFAGWNLTPPPSVGRNVEAPMRNRADAREVRRAEPPSFDEPGIGQPHRGEHRWWIAGLAGALSTILFSVLLFSLSSRSVPLSEEILFERPRHEATTGPEATPASGRSAGPELTGISANR